MGEIRVMLLLFYGISVLQYFRPTILPTYDSCMSNVHYVCRTRRTHAGNADLASK